jgi:hypothetical protein
MAYCLFVGFRAQVPNPSVSQSASGLFRYAVFTGLDSIDFRAIPFSVHHIFSWGKAEVQCIGFDSLRSVFLDYSGVFRPLSRCRRFLRKDILGSG